MYNISFNLRINCNNTYLVGYHNALSGLQSLHDPVVCIHRLVSWSQCDTRPFLQDTNDT